MTLPSPATTSIWLQPPSAAHASHSSKVTENRPTAKGRAIVTVCCGPSSAERPGSPFGDPIVKLPAGTTIISGQFAHSLNVSFGFSAFSWVGDSGAASISVIWSGDAVGCARACPSATNKHLATMQEHVAAIARPCVMGPPLPTTAGPIEEYTRLGIVGYSRTSQTGC